MNISIVENGPEIRQRLIQKFTMPWDEFLNIHKERIAALAARNYVFKYQERFLWELMDYPVISFAKALERLRNMPGEVYFMSENEDSPFCHGIHLNGIAHKGAVARMDATALADMIEYEWYEGWRLSALDMYLADTVLPDDLYVFDADLEHLLVFTHENDAWDLELEQPMKAAATRFCKAYGFDLTEV